MAQEDYVVANAAGAAFRSDLNNQLAAIATLNSGAAAPATTYANMLWVDTTNSLLKKRNNANSGWNTLGSMDTLLATTSVGGLVTELATTTEVLTGTDTVRAVTPDALAAIWEKGADIASAGTISIGEGRVFHVTGTTTITDIDFATDKSGRGAWLVFDGALTLTYNATTLILPGSASIATAAGDAGFFVSEDGSDIVRCLLYQRRDGTALVATSVSAATQADMEAASSTTVYATPGRMKYEPGVAKGWVKVSNSGTPTISQSRNVSSLTDNGTGDTTVNHTTSFSAATYSIGGSARYNGADGISVCPHNSVAPAVGSCRLVTVKGGGFLVDVDFSAQFFGDF